VQSLAKKKPWEGLINPCYQHLGSVDTLEELIAHFQSKAPGEKIRFQEIVFTGIAAILPGTINYTFYPKTEEEIRDVIQPMGKYLLSVYKIMSFNFFVAIIIPKALNRQTSNFMYGELTMILSQRGRPLNRGEFTTGSDCPCQGAPIAYSRAKNSAPQAKTVGYI
jgi:hypothetical protein